MTVDIIRTTDPVGVMKKLGRDLEKYDGVDGVALSTPNRTADLGMVQIIPAKGQTDPATADLVREIRERRGELEKRYDITDLRVTGQTAVAIDVSDRLFGALLPFGIVVVGLSLLLLMLVFRSIAVPIKATLGYLLSVGCVVRRGDGGLRVGLAGRAAERAARRTGHLVHADHLDGRAVRPGDGLRGVPGLADAGGVRPHRRRPAVDRSGFTSSARVVTAAAIIMISVFAAFVPHGDSSVQPIAFGLAVGVFVDAFLVRMTLVPAVLALLGDRAWWLPAWLDRRLPSLDVEGAGIAKHVEHEEWVEEHGWVVVRTEGLSLEADADILVEGLDMTLGTGDCSRSGTATPSADGLSSRC